MLEDERPDKVALLFEEAVEISDPGARAAYLDSACSRSAGLRREVEALLRAYEAAGHFLTTAPPQGGTNPCDPSAGKEPNLEAGTRIGHYRLMGLIGEGGSSTVYLAEQEEPIRRWVALKIVKAGMDTQQVISRFGLERQALALMDHPGIAKVFDAGATPNGRPYFVMELVQGTAITNYCDQQQLTIPQRLVLFIQVCHAVLHAHQKGVIHRDIKPDNVLVCQYDGRAVPKIIDFGIAKVLHTWGCDNTPRTGGLPFVGTPAYMSPEQAQLTTPDLDTRTDIYSLGVLLCELLTGHPPFDHKDLMAAGLEEMCRIIRTADPLGPSARLARLPLAEQSAIAAARGTSPGELRRILAGDLDWITLKALEKERDRRYATAASLAEDLKCHLEHMPVSAAAPSRRYRFSKLVRRNRKLVLATSVVGVLLLVSAFLTGILAVKSNRSAKQARSSQSIADKAERQAHQAMVAMHVSSGSAAADDLHFDRAVLWFANAARAAGKNDYQAEVNARRAMSWLSQVPLPIGAFKLPSAFQALEFSPDSRYLLALAQDHSWRLWDAQTQTCLSWTADVGKLKTAAWSPEGSRLALVTIAGKVRVYEVSEGALLHSTHISPAPAAIGFTSDARRLVLGNSTLQVLDLQGRSPAKVISQHSNAVVGLAFPATSSHVVSATEDGQARVFSIPEDSEHQPEKSQNFPHRHAIRTDACASKSKYREDFLEAATLSLPALVADGSILLTRTGPYEITFWELATKSSYFKVEDVCCSCRFITSPEAGLFACGLQGGKVGMWDILTAKPRQLLPSQGACVLDIAFGRGGKSLISAEANGMARLWSVADGKELQSPLHHCTDVDKVAFAQNGRMVATGQADGLVRVWTVFGPEPDPHGLRKDDVPTAVQTDAGGRHFLTTKEPGWDADIKQITVYSVASGQPVGPTIEVDGYVDAAALSPDSTMLAAGTLPPGDNSLGQLEFHDPITARLVGPKTPLPSRPASLAWDPLSQRVAVTCRSGELLIVQPGSESPLHWSSHVASPRARINPATAFTPDGHTLVSLSAEGDIQVREAAKGSLRFPPLKAEPDGFWSFCLSEDSRHLATTTLGGEVVIWDLGVGVPAAPVLKHPRWVYRCRFSPDQRILATSGHDGKARLWDWRAGKEITEPLMHPNEVYDAAFTPNNRWVITTCRDGNARIWEPESGRILAPPVKVGQQAFNVEITADGRHAVIGNLGKTTIVLSLDILQDDLPYDTEDLCLLGEVVSGCIIQEGALRDLTTSEWLERYEKMLQLHPKALQSGQSYALEKLGLEKAAVFKADSTPSSGPTGSLNQLPAGQCRIGGSVSSPGTDSCSTCGGCP